MTTNESGLLGGATVRPRGFLLLLTATAVAPLLLLGGCSLPANPRTTLSAGPLGSYFHFYDSKDNDVEIVGAEFDPTAKRLKFDRLTIRNNASDVRRANVEQIQAYTEQVKATTAMIASMTDIIASKMPTIGGGRLRGPAEEPVWPDAPASQPSP